MSEKKLVGVLVVTHGRLGEELVDVACRIVGDVRHISFVPIGWNDEVEASKHRISGALQALDQGKGVLVLTDMFGGTPSNISLPFLRRDRVEIVTGVNLPMVIKVANQTGEETLADLARRVCDQGQRHISIASVLLGE